MKFLWFIAVWSAALLAAALAMPAFADFVMLAAPCLAACIYLMLRHLFLSPDRKDQPSPATELHAGPQPARSHVQPRRPSKRLPDWVVVDGSNVMHWDQGRPSLETVREVLAVLAARGFTPGVIFDANAGWKLHDRYLDDHSFARQLNLPEAQVLVVPKGTPADQYILDSARELKARVVTNDRFRDWADQFPEVHKPDFLIRGGARPGHVWLDETARPKAGA